MGYHTTRFFSIIIPALLRIVVSSAPEVSVSALNSLLKIAKAVPSRFRKHSGKIVEGVCRAYIKHSSRQEKSSEGVKAASYEVINELKKINGEQFVEKWILPIKANVVELKCFLSEVSGR